MTRAYGLSTGSCVALAAAVVALAPVAAAACRCAPESLAEYFGRAAIVMQVEIVSVEPVPETTHQQAHQRATFRLLTDYKNAGGVAGLRNEATPGLCGVLLEPGERYWIFARQRPGDADAWIGACDGSRSVAQGFTDTEPERVAGALEEIAAAVECPSPTAAEIARKIRLDKTKPTGRTREGTSSPNGAYAFSLDNPTAIQRPPRVAVLTVDNERETRLQLSLHGVHRPVHAEWVNEKLIYARVVWGTTSRTDLVLDVEAEAILVADSARVDQRTGEVSWLDPDCTPQP